jgi:hypothetical protein
MDRLTETPQSENVAHAYGFTWWMKAAYLAVATPMILSAVYLIARTSGPGLEVRIWHWAEAAALALSGIYFAASAFTSCVFFDNYSVNVRGVFVTSSLLRHTIHWYSPAVTRWLPCTILYPDEPETNKLVIVHCFNFDEEWNRWIASLNRLPSE